MIEFATMCIGREWVFDWKDDIRKFHSKHNLHLLTDCGEWFEFQSYKHDKEFSYYDKLIFLLDIIACSVRAFYGNQALIMLVLLHS